MTSSAPRAHVRVELSLQDGVGLRFSRRTTRRTDAEIQCVLDIIEYRSGL